MWFSSSLEIACACSVFSFAMTVRLLISGRLLTLRSSKASLKSAATSADGKDMMGGQRATTTDDEEAGSKKKFGVAVHNSRVGEKKEVKKGTPLVLIYPYDFKLRRLRRMTRFALSADLLCSVPHPSIYTRVVLP